MASRNVRLNTPGVALLSATLPNTGFWADVEVWLAPEVDGVVWENKCSAH
jgi:hypothetical protein